MKFFQFDLGDKIPATETSKIFQVDLVDKVPAAETSNVGQLLALAEFSTRVYLILG